jgi:hypothetical protein
MILPVRNYFVPLTFLVFALFACSRAPVVPPAQEESAASGTALKNSLVGMWQMNSLVIGFDTIHNTQTSCVLQIGADEWNEKLKLQPIQTLFSPNKTYISAYCTDEGKIIRFTTGKWEVEKNQLKIHQLFPSDKQMNYRIDVSDGCAQLRSKMDFDEDGKSDDLFYCEMKKVG